MSPTPARQTPLVSIGLPVYNGAPLLTDAIRSFLDQTYSNFELILSDNASTDETAEICRGYAAKDARVRYYRNAVNLGSAANHTRTVELATGNLFKWAGSDDLYASTYLERCVEFMQAVPQAILVYPKTLIIDDDGNLAGEYEDNFHLGDMPTSGAFQRVLEHLEKKCLIRVAALCACQQCVAQCLSWASTTLPIAWCLPNCISGKVRTGAERLLYRRVYTRKPYWTVLPTMEPRRNLV